jgi:four helix bundle protein
MAVRHNFKNLKVWSKGMDAVDRVYAFSATLPEDEKYGLRSQLTRAAVSIPSNIAEGSGASTDKDFARFIGISLGSAFEVETQLLICERRGFGDLLKLNDAIATINEVQRMLMAFQDQLRKRYSTPPT